MFIGDTEITRDMMPAMQAWQMNPDHLRQTIQDILNQQTGMSMQPQQVPMQSAQPTMEHRQNSWDANQQG